MPKNPNAAAIAAFDICDSLLLSLVAVKVLSNTDVIRILEDVAETHRNAAIADGNVALHREAADRVQRLIGTRRVSIL